MFPLEAPNKGLDWYSINKYAKGNDYVQAFASKRRA